MRRIRQTLIVAATILIVPQAHAAWNTVWDFTGPAPLTGDWSQNNAVMEKTDAGIHIRTAGQGGIARLVDLSHPIDSIKIVFGKSAPVTSLFIWHRPDSPNGEFIQFPFQLVGSPNEEMKIALSNYADWNEWSNIIGIGFATPVDVTIARIELFGRTDTEKFLEMVKSFFTFDRLFPYSINFLWGPLLVSSPIARSMLYDGHPPLGWSVNRIFYAILCIAFLACLGYWFYRRPEGNGSAKRKSLMIFLSVFAALWVIFDVRMAAELGTLFAKDLVTYTLQPAGKKIFRNVQNFHDALEQSLPALTAKPTYVVLAPEPSPFKKMAAERTYPQSIPVDQNGDLSNVGAYFLFFSPNTVVDAQGRLVMTKNGTQTILAEGGTVKKFNDRVFLYVPRSNP